MPPRRRFQSEIDQIESIAETKGIDIDNIEVLESETDDGDELITFRIYETEAETEEDSIGVQVSKIPAVETGDMTFRNDIQNKLNSLKRYLADDQPSDRVDDIDDDREQSDGGESSTSTSSRARERTRDTTSDAGPGAEIDARIRDIEDEIDELEARIEEIEEKAEALDGLQKLIGGDDSE